jgi:peroxiredoxin
VKKLKNSPIFLGLLFALVSVMGIPGESLAQPIVMDKAGTRLQVTELKRDRPKPKLVLYTTMATWCVACRTEIPQFSYLRSVFKPEELGMFGLPYDDKEGSEQLKAWAVANHPPYELLINLTKDNFASVKMMVLKTLRIDAVPATIVTDSNGRILRTRWGPPSVSELRELLRSQRDLK